MTSATSGSSTELFSYADRTQAELLSDGSASAITYGLAGQAVVQDYTAAESGQKVNVLHDQQGSILGEDNSSASPKGDIMYVTDNLGSVVASVDSSGHGALTDPYTAYGLNAQPGSLDPMLTCTGALQDTVSSTTGTGTGFLHLGNRWYSPPVEPNAGVGNQVDPARFTQPDSMTQLASPADGNLYAYAADSPVNYVDPTGNSCRSALTSYSLVGGSLVGAGESGVAIADLAEGLTIAAVFSPAALAVTSILGGVFGVGFALVAIFSC
jgi:RHS repeat-associated protein